MKKIIFLILLIALSIFLSAYFYYFILVKEANIKKEANLRDIKVELLEAARESVRTKNLSLFEKIVKNILKRTNVQNTNIKLKNYLLNDELLLKSIASIDETWNILEVSVDAMQGYINYLEGKKYELIPNDKENIPDTILIKFQVEKNSHIKEFLYVYETNKEIKSQKESSNPKNISFEEEDFTLSFNYSDVPIDREKILNKTYYFALNILSLILLATIIIILVYNYFIRPKFIKNIDLLSKYMQDILDEKIPKEFYVSKDFSNELGLLNSTILNLAKSHLNLANELAISKSIVFQKERTDELTRLPNKKSFENDLKYMFVSSQSGFIVQLKIDKIGQFTNNHGPEIVDTLIEEFAILIKNFFDSSPKHNGTIYRFFGSEFAMIIYDVTSHEIEDMLKQIIDLTEKLSHKYYFFDNDVFYGATPFDSYGSIESVLQSARDTYETALKQKSKYYFIADEKNQQELNKKLEYTVKDIIARKDFVLQYLYDTYSFHSSPKLLLQEVSPLIIDSMTFESIPSSKFLSVADKLGFINDFDKALIEKLLEHIELGEISHKVSVALSVSSLSSQLFLSWLKESLSDSLHKDKLVFVAPGYSIASNYENFLSFCNFLKENELDFMIKQYNISDLDLDALLTLHPSYVRLEKAYCQDFKKDSSKQHIVKRILLFCDENNINVLGDSVKEEQDYLAFEMLGLYGTSR